MPCASCTGCVPNVVYPTPHLSQPNPLPSPFLLSPCRLPAPPGKVVIDAFRMIPDAGGMMGMLMPQAEPRQTTSHVGFLKKPTIQAQIHGLNKYYYSIVLDWRKNDLEEQVRPKRGLLYAYMCGTHALRPV